VAIKISGCQLPQARAVAERNGRGPQPVEELCRLGAVELGHVRD
jgi:hypothetical protein